VIAPLSIQIRRAGVQKTVFVTPLSLIAAVLMRRPPAAGARLFLLPWLAAALFNLYLGTQHGYSVVSELPFFAIVFGIPALAALTVMRWARSAASQP